MGIMQDLYDRCSRDHRAPGELCARGRGAAQRRGRGDFPKPVRNRADAEEVVAQFERDGLDGIMMVMLTYGPAMNVTRALVNTRLPLMLANIQPERTIRPPGTWAT